MTFSILAVDQKTGTLGGASATGSLCVGGWVLRGSVHGGLVASQGTSPSTFWRDDALEALRAGQGAKTAVESVTKGDRGKDHRQLIALDRHGHSGAFTGVESVAWAGELAGDGFVCAGNMIAGKDVLTALAQGYAETGGAMADRLLAALSAAAARGGDSRGLLSAAMLVLAPDAAPVDLRIDHDPSPLRALGQLLKAVRTRPYADWLEEVPVLNDRTRTPQKQVKDAKGD
ncbi:MAG: DUF1028 domain-containing protein [Roseobacter sp.]|nr:DUF1028 domain-containing protein [Roseobacter sp.]